MVLPRKMVEITVPSLGFSIRVKIIHSYKSIHKSICSSYNRKSLMDLTQLLTCYLPVFDLREISMNFIVTV